MTIAELQELGAKRVEALGAPSIKTEEWRYVALKDFGDFDSEDSCDIDAAAVAEEALGELGAGAVILRDGELIGGLDKLPGNTAIDVEPDEARLSEWQDRVGRADLAEAHSFADLASALTLNLSCAAEAPIVIVNVITGGAHGWRLAINAQANAIATIALVHLHVGQARSSCGVEVHAGERANIRVDELEIGQQDASTVGQAFISRELQLAADAHVSWATASTGGVLSRHLSWAHLNGPHAECSLAGIAVTDGERQAHDLVRVFHHSGEATSRQLYKTVLDGTSVCSFDGVIHVDKGADGTDAEQNSANMQLSQKARVATRPQLDIFADEVVAAHGATVGQPDLDEIRYLTSRGINPRLARALIIEGFIQEGIDHLVLQPLREIAARHLIDPLRG